MNPLKYLKSKVASLKMSDSFIVFVLILAGVLVASGYLKEGLVSSDDGALMVIRADGFYRSFVDGHLPVRWITKLNEGYGYPVANFLYPLPFYITSVLMLSGISALAAVKLVMLGATVISGLSMFWWLRGWSSNFGALVGSLAYLVAPYRIMDLYNRGSLGEVVGFAIAPLLMWRIDRLVARPAWTNVMWLGLVWSSLIPAHNSFSLIVSVLAGFYLLGRVHRKKSPALRFNFQEVVAQTIIFFKTCRHGMVRVGLTAKAGLGIILAGLLSAWFWLPALFDLPFTRSSQTPIAPLGDYFVSNLELLLQFGLFPLLVTALSIFLFKRRLVRFVWISIGLIIYLSTPASVWLWQLLSLDKLIQFPFRLLIVSSLLVPLLLALLIDWFKRKNYSLEWTFLCLLLGLVYWSQIETATQWSNDTYEPGYYQANFDTTTNKREFTPKWVYQDPSTLRTQAIESLDSRPLTIIELHERTQETFVQLEVKEPQSIVFNTHYYPNWQVLADDQPLEISPDSRGRIVVEVPVPERRDSKIDLKLVWRPTPIHVAAEVISLVSLLFTLIVLLKVGTGRIDKTVFWMSIFVVVTVLGLSLLSRHKQLLTVFDPIDQEQRYLDSQWVNPESTRPIGDHGLYSWAGWAYVHGTNPILINPEMPPLGKYLIGLGTLMTGRTALVGLFFNLTFLFTLYLLAKTMIDSKYWAMLPVALLVIEPIFNDSLVYPMLDGIQLTGMCLAFFALIMAEQKRQLGWYLIAGLGLGIVLSSKFYATGLMLALSIVIFYMFTGRWRQLNYLAVSMVTMVSIHIASYTRFFMLGGSLREYLGAQRWIYEFYRSGSPDVPLGSYWQLVLFNRWHVWWNTGVDNIISSNLWRPTWPIALVVVVDQVHMVLKNLYTTKVLSLPIIYLPLSWLLVYSVFLSMIGGWPHYLLQFLPFAYIYLTMRLVEFSHHYQKT